MIRKSAPVRGEEVAEEEAYHAGEMGELCPLGRMTGVIIHEYM